MGLCPLSRFSTPKHNNTRSDDIHVYDVSIPHDGLEHHSKYILYNLLIYLLRIDYLFISNFENLNNDDLKQTFSILNF